MDDKDLKIQVRYYCRGKLCHAMQSAALDGFCKYPGDATFRMYNGLSLVLGRHIQEGIYEFEPLQSECDVVLGTILALMFAYRHYTVLDRETLAQLES